MGIYDTIRELELMAKKIKIYTIVPPVCIAIGFVLYMGNMSGFGMAFLVISAISFLLLYSQTYFLKKEYRRTYKETFVVSMLKTMFEDVEYDWNCGFTGIDIMQSGLVKIGNQVSSEDFLKASYNGITFRQADVTSINETYNGDEKETVTYFNGRVIEFDYTIKMSSSVKVLSHTFTTYLNLPNEHINMEDLEFNKLYDVYSLEPHDAFYILTPHLMERLKDISKKYGVVGFNFSQGKIYFAIEGRDTFDVGFMTKISYVEEKERMKKDVQVIIDIINMLGLI